MTSVASYGGATTAGNYTLIHSGALLGNWVEDFTTEFRRLTAISQKQNFWASKVVQDGRYPAQTWRHIFRLYTEADSLGGFYEKFLLLHDQIDGTAQALTVNDGDTANAVYEYGPCYIEEARILTPAAFNQHQAGVLEVTFIGCERPTVNNLP